VPGRDLYVPQVDAGVEHGRDEGVPQHVRVHPREPDASLGSQVTQPSGGGMCGCSRVTEGRVRQGVSR
jgi:hypothetical protein